MHARRCDTPLILCVLALCEPNENLSNAWSHRVIISICIFIYYFFNFIHSFVAWYPQSIATTTKQVDKCSNGNVLFIFRHKIDCLANAHNAINRNGVRLFGKIAKSATDVLMWGAANRRNNDKWVDLANWQAETEEHEQFYYHRIA